VLHIQRRNDCICVRKYHWRELHKDWLILQELVVLVVGFVHKKFGEQQVLVELVVLDGDHMGFVESLQGFERLVV